MSLTARMLFKRVLHGLLGDYQYWQVFAIDLPQPPAPLPDNVSIKELDPNRPIACDDDEIISRMTFGGSEAVGFGLFEGEQLVAVQWYWWGKRYERERGGRSWRLPINAAKSTGLYTVPHRRGRGYAAILKQQTAYLMSGRGFTRLYSRIWHSHTSSIRVSKKIGWRHVGSYIEICPFSRRIELRIPC